MTQLVNTFEGGTNGTTLTGGSGGNTGTGADDYIDTINRPSDGILQFTNAQVAAGSLACRMATRTVTGALDMLWLSGSRGQIADDYIRFYFWTDDKNTGGIVHHIVRWYGALGAEGGISMGNNRLYAVPPSDNNVVGNSTTLLAASQWVRIEARLHPLTNGTGSVQVKMWLTASSTGVPDWDFTISSLTMPQNYTDEIIFGEAGAPANWPSAAGFIYFDEIVTGAATWPGPVSTATTTVTPTSAVSMPTLSPFAAELYLQSDVLAVSTASSTPPPATSGRIDIALTATSALSTAVVSPPVVTGPVNNATLTPNSALTTSGSGTDAMVTASTPGVSIPGSVLLDDLAIFPNSINVDDLSVYTPQVSDVAVFVGAVDDTPGH